MPQSFLLSKILQSLSSGLMALDLSKDGIPVQRLGKGESGVGDLADAVSHQKPLLVKKGVRSRGWGCE